MLIDWPVVHLQSGVTPVPGEAHQVVFAVVDGGAGLLHADVHRPDVEGHAYFALLLENKRTQKQFFIRKSSGLVVTCPSTFCQPNVHILYLYQQTQGQHRQYTRKDPVDANQAFLL